MFEDEEQQRRYEQFLERRARYLCKDDVGQERPEIVYKRYEPRQSSKVMDSDTEAKWNRWCDDRIARQIETELDLVAAVFGTESAKNERKLEKRLLAKIDAL